MIKTVKDSLTFSSARYVLMGLSALRNFALAKVLDPENYGYWVVLSLVFAYGDQIHLGLRHAGDRDIPFLRGRKEDDEAELFSKVLFSGILLFSTLGFLALSLADVSEIVRLGPLRHVLVLAGLIIAGEQVSRFSYMILRTRREFVLSSRLEIVFETMRTATVCFFAVWQGVYGALLGFLVTSVANIAYFGFVLHLPSKPVFDFSRLKIVLNTGFLLFAAAIVQVLLFNMDRVIGAFALTPSKLGIYGLAALVTQLPIMFSQSISTVFVPSGSRAFGIRSSVRDVSPLFVRFLRATALIGPLFCAAVLFFSGPFIGWLLPDYAPAIPILTILIPGAMFAVLIPPSSALLVVTRRVPFLLILEIVGVLGAAGLFWSAFAWTEGLQALSLGMVAAAVWHSGLSLIGAVRIAGFSAGQQLREVLVTYGPSVYAIMLLFVIVPGLLGGGAGIQNDLLGFILFVLFYLPILLIGVRSFKQGQEAGIMVDGDPLQERS